MPEAFYFRVTVTDLQPVFPAKSLARTTMLLVPTSSGTSAVQLVVPVAVPDLPVEVVHVTLTTPMLSLAVPVSLMLAAEVSTLVAAGLVILMSGATVSVTAIKVAVTVRESVTFCVSATRIVIALPPN